MLCVIIIKVWPKSLFNLRNKLCNSSAFLESRFPEGASANIIEGELINALATATLCCAPPDSSSGLWLDLLLKPSNSKSSKPFFSAFFLGVPATKAGRQIINRRRAKGRAQLST